MISDLNIVIPQGDNLSSFDTVLIQKLIETVCLLYHQKKDFISVPYKPKDDGYLKQQK